MFLKKKEVKSISYTSKMNNIPSLLETYFETYDFNVEKQTLISD